MGFKARTTEPSCSDKNWIHTNCGGYNNAYLVSGNSCLPNCTGYAIGRWGELYGWTAANKLCRGHAKSFYNYNDGYLGRSTPVLGAIVCWGANSSNSYGHVAVVEGIWDNGNRIVVSQSNYGGKRWELVSCYRMANGGYRSAAGNTNFLGFIWPPDSTSDTATTSTKKYGSVDEIAKAIINGTGEWYKVYGNARKKKVESYGYNYAEVQARVNSLMKG